MSDIDLILLDLDIPGAHGFNTLSNIRRQYPDIGVVVFFISGFEEPETIHKAMSFGAAGFHFQKSTPVPEMIKAINDVIQGKLWTPEGVYNPDEQLVEQEDKTSIFNTHSSIKILFYVLPTVYLISKLLMNLVFV